MTKEGFEQLQLNHQQSGMSLKMYLKQIGTSYSTYYYWRKKFSETEGNGELAPITFKATQPAVPSFSGQPVSGASLLFPNGLRAYFGQGTESVLMELLTKSLSCHVLP